MKASSIFEALRVLVSAHQPVFVWGGPGIGKSALIRQLAGALKVTLRDVRALFSTPSIYAACHSWGAMAGRNGRRRSSCRRTEREFSSWTN